VSGPERVQEETMSSDIFRKANHLWFREGRTAAALRAYEEAFRLMPSDPVVAFQLSRVLWSLDRREEARSALAQAFAQSHALSRAGQRVLESWRRRLDESPPQRYFPELGPADLDRDELEKSSVEVDDWRRVADAAASRKMYGLAVYALRRWDGTPIDAEDARDIGLIETNRDTEEAMLAQMRADRDPGEAIVPQKPATPVQAGSLPPVSSSPAASSGASQSSMMPELPLSLSARVSPSQASVGAPTTLVATLSNPTGSVQGVNSRLLVNRVGHPGEIWLEVQGPPGYRNHAGFRVRPGVTPPEFFVRLQPGGAVEQSWTLNDYESLHVPGEYRVIVTYHNEATHAPGGWPMAVGKVSAITYFRRDPDTKRIES
jgi:hypothetical protein